MVIHHKRHKIIYMTNQLIVNFYELSGIFIEKCSFYAACQFSMQNLVQSTKWHWAINWLMQSTCWPPLVYFSVCISFWLEFWTFYLKFYAVNLCWKTVWVCSFCKLHSFTIFYTVIYSQCYKIYFLYFINWLNAGALGISWCRWNWSYDKDYILGLADLLCHITKNPNPNCKLVYGFQNLLKKCYCLHQKYPIKRVVSISPA